MPYEAVAIAAMQSSAAQALIARIERLPSSRWAIRTRLIVGVGTFFDGFDSLSVAFILPVLVPLWHMSAVQAGFVLTSGSVGQFFGALTCGWLAERYGRRPIVILAIASFSVTSFLAAFSWNFQSLLILRFIQGFGLGGEVPVAASYISELAKAQTRGRFVMIYESLFGIGLFCAAAFGAWIVPTFGWQYLMILGSAPAILILFLGKLLPESPRWLVSHGRLAEAESALGSIERTIEAEGKVLPPPQSIDLPAPPERGHWTELFSGFYGKRTALAWAIAFTIGFMAHGVSQWLPTLYRVVFHLDLAVALRYALVTTTTSTIVAVIAAWYIDIFDRRTWLMINFLCGGLMLGILWLFGVPSANFLLVFVTIGACFIPPNVSLLYLYLPELYPTRMRAIGVGTAISVLRIGQAVAPLVVGFILPVYGIGGIYLVFALIGIFAAILIPIFGVKTRRRVLETVSP